MASSAQVSRAFAADYQAIRALGPWLDQEMPKLGCASELIERTSEIELAVHELAVNTIDHAIGIDQGELTIEMSYDVEASELLVGCRDDGAAFDTQGSRGLAHAPQVRGFGLIIIEQLASSVEYRRINETNEWAVRFTRTRRVPEPSRPS